MRRIILIGLLFGLGSPSLFLGAEESYEESFQEACAFWEVPAPLALAIARQESGLKPWAVNVAGRSFQPKTRETALRLAEVAWRGGYSFDLGLMQVNSYWLKKFNISPATALEPKNNVLLGVWILSKEIERHGLTWRAVASYHTPLERNPERGYNYAAAVIRQMRLMKPAAAGGGSADGGSAQAELGEASPQPHK